MKMRRGGSGAGATFSFTREKNPLSLVVLKSRGSLNVYDTI